MAQINFGLLDTSIPQQLGAIPGNALAMRRQRMQQDEDRAFTREGQQMQNALARMQMSKAQADIDEETAYKTALSGVQGNDYAGSMPKLMQASPSRALALQKQLTEQQKALIEGRAKMTDLQGKKLDMYRGQLTEIQTPEQMANWYIQQRKDTDLQDFPWPTTIDDTLSQLKQASTNPRDFEQWKLKTALGMKAFMEAQPKPTQFMQELQARGIQPGSPEWNAALEAKARKETTHAPAANVNVGFPKETFKNERDMRNDFQGLPTVKAFREVETAYDQIRTAATKPSPANDLAAATKFMKLLDPNSVVRESELAMAMQATGLWDRMTNYHNRLLKGEKLTPAQRADFLQAAEGLYGAAAGRYNQQADEYRGMAKDYQLNPDRIAKPAGFGGEKKPAARQEFDSMPNPAQYAGKVVTDTETGIRYRSNGKQWMKE